MPVQTVLIRDAEEGDLATITAIYNDAVATTTAIWNDVLVDLDNRRAWWTARRSAGCPVLVADAGGSVAGYASYGPFRAFDGYRHTAELSIYVDGAHRGAGVGSMLLAGLEARARAAGLHVLVAAIEAGNLPSIRLHHRQGFLETGRMPEVGRKFDRWLDLVFMQKLLGENDGSRIDSGR